MGFSSGQVRAMWLPRAHHAPVRVRVRARVRVRVRVRVKVRVGVGARPG